jgi:hypothetical protein
LIVGRITLRDGLITLSGGSVSLIVEIGFLVCPDSISFDDSGAGMPLLLPGSHLWEPGDFALLRGEMARRPGVVPMFCGVSLTE